MKINNTLLKIFGSDIFGSDDVWVNTNIWATEIKFIADHVGIKRFYDQDNKKQTLAILIDSETGKKDIPLVWSVIENERQLLVNIQGPDLNDYLQVTLNSLKTGDYEKIVLDETAPPNQPFRYKRIKSKPEYRDILMDANFDLLVFAIRASKTEENPERARIANHFLGDLWRLYAGRKKIEVIEAELEDWKMAAFDEISKGRCPEDIYDGPITYEKVSNKIEDIRDRFNSAVISSQSKTNLIKVYGLFVVWSDWKEATNILESSFPDTFYKYKSRLDGRLDEILRK